MPQAGTATQTTPPAIEAQGVSKVFRPLMGRGDTVQALSDVSFTVPRGGVFCILGPNGAGKTTLLRILTTMLVPDTGTVTVGGFDIGVDKLSVRKKIGILAQENHFDKYLTVWHNLTVHAQMHGMSREEYEPRLTELLKIVGLYERRFSYLEQLSGGMQRRIALIRSMIHRPEILFLDEPSTGLDPEVRREIWCIIEDLKQSSTVILTTHYMEEADYLSDEIMMLKEGRVVMQGDPAELKRALSPENTFDFIFNGSLAAEYQERLARVGYTDTETVTRNQLRVTLPSGQKLRHLLEKSWMDWADIQSVGETHVNLETVYLSVAGQKRPVSAGKLEEKP